MTTLNETHARMQARVWQALAETDLDTGAVDKELLKALVDLATEAALLEMDAEMTRSLKDEMANEAGTEMKTAVSEDILSDHKEDILWEGRPFLSLVLDYTITDERVRITEGLLGKRRENIELVRVQDLDYSQTFSDRLLNLGDITIRSHDTSHPQIVLKNVRDPEQVYEILRRAVLHARKKHGFTYREEM
jgi:hypothetical protein